MKSIKRDTRMSLAMLAVVLMAVLFSAYNSFEMQQLLRTSRILDGLRADMFENFLLEKNLGERPSRDALDGITANYERIKGRSVNLQEAIDPLLIDTRMDLLTRRLDLSLEQNSIEKDLGATIQTLIQDGQKLFAHHKARLLDTRTPAKKGNSNGTAWSRNLEVLFNLNMAMGELFSIHKEFADLSPASVQRYLFRTIEDLKKHAAALGEVSGSPQDTLMAENLLLRARLMGISAEKSIENQKAMEDLSHALEKNRSEIIELMASASPKLQERLDSSRRKVQTAQVLAFLATTFLVMVVAVRLNRVSKALSGLAKDTKTLREDHSHRITPDVRTGEECVALATALNDMAAELDGMIKGLEERVRERTEGLRKEVEERTKAQAELQGLKDNLEILVQERTRDLEREIDERKAIEEELRKLTNAIEHSPASIMITNTMGTIQYVNPKFSEITGYSFDEVVSKKPNILKSGVHPPEFYAALWKTITSGKEWRGEFCNKKKNGDVYWDSASISPVRNEAGEITHYVSVNEDITLQKKAETDRLKFEKLQSLGILASGIAHHFNNFLMAIMGNISLARTHAKDPLKIDLRLDEAEKCCDRAAHLVSQLLTFAEGGEPLKEPSDVRTLVRDAASFALAGSNVRLVVAPAQDLWAAEVDKAQMEQVFSNLLLNAKDAMPRGGAVRVTMENAHIEGPNAPPPGPGKYVVIRIADEGVGIPADILPKIFDPYFTTKAFGSGLGLATVHSIIKKHEGHVTVSSETGRGTEFTLFLPSLGRPLKEIETLNGNQPMIEEPSGTGASGKRSALVMDDEPFVLEAMGAMLFHMDFHVEVAHDGEEAVEAYRASMDQGKPFDLVFLDLTIPGGMGAEETVGRLRELDPGVKAIVSSGYTKDPLMSQYREAGFAAAIPKPYTLEGLERAVKEALGSTAAQKENPDTENQGVIGSF